MTAITSQQKRELKNKLHSLKPVVIVGSDGLTNNVLLEIERALDDHELIKVRLSDIDRVEREEMATNICKTTRAALIQSIGHIIAIYRKNPKLN